MRIIKDKTLFGKYHVKSISNAIMFSGTRQECKDFIKLQNNW